MIEAAVVIILILFVLYKIWAYNHHWKYVMKIPGPKGWPIIGCSLAHLDYESIFEDDRKRALNYYPIHLMWALHIYVICIVGPEDLEIILGNSVHNHKGGLYKFLEEWLGTGLLTSNGNKWQTRRKLLTPAFHFSILPKFVDIFNKETDELVTTLLQKSHQDYVNVLEPITEFTLFTIGESSLGVDLRDLDSASYKRALHKYGEIAALRLINPFYYFDLLFSMSSKSAQLSQAARHLHGVSTSIIQAKKRSRSNIDGTKLSYSERKKLALLDVLMEAGLQDEDIREEVDTFVFEGHDTTSMAICYMLVTLANEQEHQEAIYQEMLSILGPSARPSFGDLGELKFMEMCIKECLRLYPSVPVISRRAGRRIETHSGYTIPEGSQILLRIYDLHRSPYVWDDPEKFDPDRFLPDNVAKRHPFAYIPFSAGSRNCIGQKFAMLEMKTVLCGILRKFKLMPVDRREDLKFKIDLVLRPVGEIRVKFLPR
ncbi:unnamed protein product [Phyllotreta striolata]|uniref:Cytochrome P450 monooxygenase n=1 Tax=Phyllotreta striolata TaxID=444603 RepID=A0A9N9TYL0_PHYSR|nr:unnamed protein product [Phyllotreta striolata]